MPEELLHDSSIRIRAIEEVLRLIKPVIGIRQIPGVHNELIVVDGVRQTPDSRVVKRGIDRGYYVPLCLVRRDRVAVDAVHAEVDDGVKREGPGVACRARAEEVLDGGVRRRDLVVVRRAGRQVGQCYRVAPRPRGGIRDGYV